MSTPVKITDLPPAGVLTGTERVPIVTGNVTQITTTQDIANLGSGAPGTVTSVDFSGGSTGLSATGVPITTSGTISLTGTLVATHGGTGLSVYVQGDILYSSAANTLSRLAAGSPGDVLTTQGSGANPIWAAVAAVSSLTPGYGLTSTITATAPGSAITTNGTLYAAELVNNQVGTSYVLHDSDRAHLVTFNNGGSIAVSLAQAGVGSAFQAGWWVDVMNLGVGTVTITPATSTINGAVSLALTTNQGCRIASGGTNYYALLGGSGGGSSGLIVGVTSIVGGTSGYALIDGGGVLSDAAIRTKLAVDTTYYVATTGSDVTGDGSVGNPWATIQFAADTLCATLDFGIYDVTIQIADGTYLAGVTNTGHVGSGTLIFQGSAVTASNVVISTVGNCFTFTTAGNVAIYDMKITSSGGNGIRFGGPGAFLTYGGIEFGTISNWALRVESWSTAFGVATANPYKISGNCNVHIFVDSASFYLNPLPITLTGTPHWGLAFVVMADNSVWYVDNITFSGSATGVRFSLVSGAQLSGFPSYFGYGGLNFFPGNSAGFVSGGALYAGFGEDLWSITQADGALALPQTLTAKRYVSAQASGATVSATADNRKLFTNEGAGSLATFNLPTAAANLEYIFVVEDSDGLKVVANTGDTIRSGPTVSASAGNIQSTVIGSTINIVAINATEWIVTYLSGTWTIT